MFMSKKKIIGDTAIQLFVELGFHGTATSKIAEQSGVANGTLFNYFNTKDELIVELYKSILEERNDFLIKKMASHSISKTSFQSLFTASIVWSLDNPIRYQYLQQFNHSPYVRVVSSGILSFEEQPLFILIQNGINVVLLKPLAASFIFSLVTAQINGLYFYIVSNDFSKAEQLALIQECFEMVWKMVED